MQPLVSIVMSVYNGMPYVEGSIQSVLSQTFPYFEFIIVNDGSTDETSKVLQNYTDERIKYYELRHVGLARALNYGLDKASGAFIARIDADDIWDKRKLEIQYNYLNNHSNIALVGTTIEWIDKEGKHLRFSGEELSAEQLKHKIYQQNVLCHSSVVFKKEVLETVGKYNERYQNSLDYEYWLRILKHFDGLILPDMLVKYRLTLGMLSIKKRYQQNKEVFTIKISNFRGCFKFRNIKYIAIDVYRLLIPDFIIRLHKKVRKKEL